MNSDPMPSSTNWAAELREMVNRSFDTNEMHELAFDFNLDYDDIMGRGKSGKIVELLQVLARQRRIPEFIERCQALRPREDWQPLLEMAQREPLSFTVEDEAVETAVSSPKTAPSLLQNRNLLIGVGALVILVIIVLVVMNLGGSGGQFGGDEGLAIKIDSLVSNSQAQNQLIFAEGVAGWQMNASQAVVSEDTLQLGPDSVLVRDRTFGPGQGILLDFALSEVSSSNPVVTFSLQNAQNREDATRIISLQALTQPESAAIENGEAMAASQFARNTTLMADTNYTMVMGFDSNGRFLASLFGFSVSTDQDAKFIHETEGWADETWWFHIDTGDQGSLTLLGGWEFSFDSVK